MLVLLVVGFGGVLISVICRWLCVSSRVRVCLIMLLFWMVMLKCWCVEWGEVCDMVGF